MKYHILAVGLSEYQDQTINSLSFAAKDASEFFNLFINNVPSLGFNKLLTDSEGTLTQIRTALGQELIREINEEDAFFFFYSGHGATANDQDEKSLAHFLLPFDATRDITNSCLSVSYLKDIFDKLKCKKKFIFIDSCFSGAINSKSISQPKHKDIKTIKTLTETISGVGYLSFSASKDNEPAIEDPEFQNGLFTYYLLEELQDKREGDKFAILDIFTPISEKVTKRAKEKYNHDQTPTLKSHIEGNLYLPIFKKRLRISPDIIDIPKYPQLSTAVYSIPEIQLSDKKTQKLINDTIDLVVNTSKTQEDPMKEIIYERFCVGLKTNFCDEWEKIFVENGGNLAEIPNSVAKAEAAAFQYMVIGAVTCVFGSEKQILIFSECTCEILNLTKNRAGLMALIAVPEIIVAEIVYLVGVLSIARKKIKPFKILLNSNVEALGYRREPFPLIEANHIYYCDALGGNSTTVNDHIREILNSFTWLIELAPKLNSQIDNYQRQVNFLLTMLLEHMGDRLWADFGRWEGWRIMPLINNIKFDKEFRQQIAELFSLKEDEIRNALIKYLRSVMSKGLDRYFWNSIDSEDMLTEKELKEIEKAQKATSN